MKPAPKTNSPVTVSLSAAGRGLLVFFILALALNAASLHRNNEQMPYGPLRSFWVSVSAPADKAARALRLDLPRQFLTRELGDPLNKTNP